MRFTIVAVTAATAARRESLRRRGRAAHARADGSTDFLYNRCVGIDYEMAHFLLDAKLGGVVFSRTLTLGRPTLYLTKRQLSVLARKRGLQEYDPSIAADAYADRFLATVLGAEHLTSLDRSDYEGASLAHDLNVEIPEALEQSADIVIDGGTLEHVFNFPVAIENCMRLVRTGGALFVFTPANNQLGHGFYQFSPELFYRVLTPDRGFRIEEMRAVEFKYMATQFGSITPSYRVIDPAASRTRITVANKRPLGLFIRAQKLRHERRPFAIMPEQSDYTAAWRGVRNAPEVSRAAPVRFARAVARRLPAAVAAWLVNQYGRHHLHTLRNRRGFARSRDTF
jgi:SAM-dependent methyltransferase